MKIAAAAAAAGNPCRGGGSSQAAVTAPCTKLPNYMSGQSKALRRLKPGENWIKDWVWKKCECELGEWIPSFSACFVMEETHWVFFFLVGGSLGLEWGGEWREDLRHSWISNQHRWYVDSGIWCWEVAVSLYRRWFIIPHFRTFAGHVQCRRGNIFPTMGVLCMTFTVE